jgi:hypothetical protein
LVELAAGVIAVGRRVAVRADGLGHVEVQLRDQARVAGQGDPARFAGQLAGDVDDEPVGDWVRQSRPADAEPAADDRLVTADARGDVYGSQLVSAHVLAKPHERPDREYQDAHAWLPPATGAGTDRSNATRLPGRRR